MNIEIGQDEKFILNDDQSYEENLDRWVRWTNRERLSYGEKEITKEEAKEKFKVLYGSI
jgi:hypothetical protein